MVKKLTQHGNSLALVIDKPVLDLLCITPDTPLEIRTDGKRLIISPAEGGAARKKAFRKALDEVNREWGDVLKRLAE